MATQLNVLNLLASSMDRRDEEPNLKLTQKIVETNDQEAVQVLIDLLMTAKKAIQTDCIKVLYEVGEQAPELIADHLPVFLELLSSKNNRLQWGAMTALDAIATARPTEIYAVLTTIVAAGEQGSVITRDHAVGILIKLAAHADYQLDALPLLNEQMMRCPGNQLPMYAERAWPVIPESHRSTFQTTLTQRLGDLEKASKRNRVEKVIRKLNP